MEAHEYQTLFDFETTYWWYRGLRRILIGTLRGLGVGPAARVLDAGCGTGELLRVIRREVTARGVGFDASRHAARFWPRRGLTGLCLASVNEIPFRDGVFDAALCVDVLESEGVDDVQAYRELWRVVRPGGFVLLVVPAYPWLADERHHRAVHATRRYTRQTLAAVLATAPVRVLRLTHLFPTVLPLVAAYRLLQRYGGGARNGPPRSDLRPLPALVNEALFRVVDVERLLLQRVDFPFGSSILSVVQKVSP